MDYAFVIYDAVHKKLLSTHHTRIHAYDAMLITHHFRPGIEILTKNEYETLLRNSKVHNG